MIRMNSFVLMTERLKRIGLLLVLVLVSFKATAQSQKDSVEIKEIVVFTTRGINASGARYHLDGCRYLKNGQIKIDERVAIQRGLLPCSVCLPDRTSVIGALRQKEEVKRNEVYRKCVFKTSSGAKCTKPAIPDSRYCKLHKSRERSSRRR